jgi:DNA-binding CsgD family transcriptional regulator
METRLDASGRHRPLRGRADECALLERLLADVRRGEGRSLVVRGEAGIGKTALLEHLLESASDMTVLRAVGVESEMELAYASLHQLCAPLLDRLEELAAPQREALRVVFGLTEGAPPDRFLVGLGVLSLMSEVAEERPLLCVVDDAQWLDQASALTIAFVARRLLAEPVGVVFAAREPGEELQHISELEVRGLINGDARALLGTAVQFILDAPVRERIVAETRGNPLALLELPRGLTSSELALGFGLLDGQALPRRIEETFTRRLDALPEETRRLLLVAAAEPVGDPGLLWQAAEQLGIEPGAADRAEAQGLLAIGDRVIFRHPLVRSAVYRSALADERRAVHQALGAATNRELDPDRRAWHLAAAAAGTDEAVAIELERSAERARTRGGFAAAAAFLRRSVQLTGDPDRRTDRALAAAHATLQAGEFDTAVGLLDAAEGGTLDDLQRAEVDLLRAEAAYSLLRGSDALPLLLRAAKTLEPLDVKRARETYLDAWSAGLYAGDASLHDVAREVRAAPGPVGEPRPADLLLDGLALIFTGGRPAATPVLTRAVAGFAGTEASVEEVLRWGWVATVGAACVWDHEGVLATSTRGVEVARASGALAVLAVSLNVAAQGAVWAGDFAKASRLVADAAAVVEATGARDAPYGAVTLAGFKGVEAEALPVIDTMIEKAAAGGQGIALQYACWARSMLFNGLGRYGEAVEAARSASDDTPEMINADWALSELIEAAARSGQPALASGAAQRLAEHVRASATDWGLGLEARARALLSEGETADRLYREAIERLSRTQVRPELGRAHLLYGEWLRREGRRVHAREQLHVAYQMFTKIGMEAFAERTRIELVATGEKVRKRTVGPRDELTAQERQIAGLARDRLSNGEIAARLFLSPRTVEWHLRKVFTKLGINSRRELAKALDSSESASGLL